MSNNCQFVRHHYRHHYHHRFIGGGKMAEEMGNSSRSGSWHM